MKDSEIRRERVLKIFTVHDMFASTVYRQYIARKTRETEKGAFSVQSHYF